MSKVTEILKVHWPAILAFGIAFWVQFGTTITTWIAAHPKYAGWSNVIAFVVAYYLRSPIAQSPKP